MVSWTDFVLSYWWERLQRKLTRCRASVPTDRQILPRSGSWPTGTDRACHGSVQLHWAPRLSLQSLKRRHVTCKNHDFIRTVLYFGFSKCLNPNMLLCHRYRESENWFYLTHVSQLKSLKTKNETLKLWNQLNISIFTNVIPLKFTKNAFNLKLFHLYSTFNDPCSVILCSSQITKITSTALSFKCVP